MCMLVATSVEHEEAPLMGAVRAIVMDSQYLIEPCGSGKARLTHICRIDLKYVSLLHKVMPIQQDKTLKLREGRCWEQRVWLG